MPIIDATIGDNEDLTSPLVSLGALLSRDDSAISVPIHQAAIKANSRA